MEGSLSVQTSARGAVNLKNKSRLSKLDLSSKYGMQHLVARQTIALVIVGFSVACSNAMRKFNIIRIIFSRNEILRCISVENKY